MDKELEVGKERLRKQAEALLVNASKPVGSLTPTEVRDLLHDYQVHQIELELQNEELRSAQKQLESTRDQFARLYDDAPVGYLTIDENGIISQANQTFTDMVGQKSYDLPGASLASFIVPADRGAFYGRYRAFFRHPGGKKLDFRLQGPTGERDVRCVGRVENAAPVHCTGEACGRMLLAVIDVTEQARAERALREHEQYLSTILETTRDGFWILDARGRVKNVNAAYLAMSGYTRDELLRMSIPDLEALEGSGEIKARIKKIIAQGGQCFETRHRRKDGSMFDVEISVSAIPTEGGKFVCFCRDITERKEAESEIKRVNQRLELANAEKDKLFSIIAHDLKSPMSGLVGTTEMLAREPEIFSDKDFRYVAKEMHKNAVNTFTLLEDLLQWARMSQGGIDYAPVPSRLDDLMAMGISTGQDMARAKEITIRKDIPPGLTVFADQPMLKTVIRNILFNAIKFTHRGGEIGITARQKERMVTVAIQDNGIGIKEQILSTLFTLEKEKRQLGTEGEKGTGLGLVLCKQFIEQHGGEIRVESIQGQGTTVFFSLPFEEAA